MVSFEHEGSMCDNLSGDLKDLEPDDDIDDYWAEPLIRAIIYNDLPALESELLKDPKILKNFCSKNYPPPLHLACIIGRLSLIKAMMDTDEVDLGERDKDGVTAFHLACSAGNMHVIKYFLEEYLVEGVDDEYILRLVYLLDANEQTPLHKAAACPNPSEMVPYLLKKGSSAIALDKYNKLPSDYCFDPKATRMLDKIVYEVLGKLDKSSTDNSDEHHST